MRRRLLVIPLVAAAFAVAGATSRADDADPGTLAIEAVQKLLLALRLVIDDIPRYEMPEMLPNGDIIIRRKRTEPDAPPALRPDQPRDRGTASQPPELAL